jgi:hypothetical protein
VRAVEHDHESVAEVLDLAPSVAVDLFPQGGEVLREDPLPGPAVDRCEQRGRSDDVCEQDRLGLGRHGATILERRARGISATTARPENQCYC